MAYAATPKSSSVAALTANTAVQAPGTPAAGRLLLKIFNDDPAANIYYGDSTVTVGTGIPIPPGGESEWIPCSGAVYVISLAGGSTVRTLELS